MVASGGAGPRSRPGTLGVLSLLLLLAVTGCGFLGIGSTASSQPPTPTETTFTPTQPPSPPSWPAPRVLSNGCSTNEGIPVPMTGFTPQAELDLGGLAVCRDVPSQHVWIHNDSFVVWVVNQPSTGPLWMSRPDSEVEAFRMALLSAHGSDSTVEPGEWKEFLGAAADVRLGLDTATTATWQTMELVSETAKEASVDVFAKVVGGDSTTRSIAVECALAGFSAGEDLDNPQRKLQQAPVLFLDQQLNTANSFASCRKEINDAKTNDNHFFTVSDLDQHLTAPDSRIFKVTDEALREAEQIAHVAR